MGKISIDKYLLANRIIPIIKSKIPKDRIQPQPLICFEFVIAKNISDIQEINITILKSTFSPK